MTEPRHSDGYSPTVITLHWLTVLLVAAAYATIEFREVFPRGSVPREALKSAHFMIGLTILALVVLRIVARLTSATPAIVPPPPAWQNLVARTVHLALFALMIVLPVLGWITLSAAGKLPAYFGFELPPLVGADKVLAERTKNLHEAIGKIGYALIALHAAAALMHHYVIGDNTLLRILPARR